MISPLILNLIPLPSIISNVMRMETGNPLTQGQELSIRTRIGKINAWIITGNNSPVKTYLCD